VKVRAITTGVALDARLDRDRLAAAARVSRAVAGAVAAAGLEVQTLRLTTPPLDTWGDGAGHDLPSVARALEALAGDAGFGYVALGAVDTVGAAESHWRPLLEALPETVRGTESVFAAASVATLAGGINLAAARLAGEVVAEIAATTADGFGNLRFAALANCPPHIPFFPAAYHDGGEDVVVGLALEAADLAVQAFDGAADLEDAEARLVRAIVDAVRPLYAAAEGSAGRAGARFSGVDLSLAPFPADDRSIAAAFERLGLPAFGAHGTLFVASLLTAALRRAARLLPGARTGFSGLMLPVLEDSVLAARAAAGTFGVDSLLLYSAVCGLGLDTVPVPGDTAPSELAAIVLDTAALAVRLDKPLTARLFPVPGKRAGDAVRWDFAYFAPSRVLPVRGMGPEGALATSAVYNPQAILAPGDER
jgi:uncharacterized protein (UPF0210 family)